MSFSLAPPFDGANRISASGTEAPQREGGGSLTVAEPKHGWARAGQVLYRLSLALFPLLLLNAYAGKPDNPGLEILIDSSWYVVLVPWLLLYTDDRHPRVSIGYFIPTAWLTWMALYPVTHRFGPAFTLVASTVFMFGWLLFPIVMRRIHHRLHLPRVLTLPFLWVAIEWVRSATNLAHLDFYRLGSSQTFTELVQISDVTGIYGVSFLVAAVNGLIVDLFFMLRDRRFSPRAAWFNRRALVSVSAVVLMFIAALGYARVRVPALRVAIGPAVAIVQPDVEHRVNNAVGVHLMQVLLTDDLVPPQASDLIVWPENAILDNMRRPGAYLEDLSWLAGRKSAWFLVGSMDTPDAYPGHTSNSAFLIDQAGEIRGDYDKQLLFPWSEYVPWDGAMERVYEPLQHLYRTLIRKGWGFLPAGVPGTRMKTLSLEWDQGTVPFSVLICYENTYPPMPAAAARQGARFFVHMTSEGRVGGPMQKQLLRMSVIRAVENRISYVRAGNTGISGFIDPAGRIQSVLRGRRGKLIYDQGVHIDRVPLSDAGVTLYARSHDAFAKLCLLVGVGLYLWSWIPWRRQRAHGG